MFPEMIIWKVKAGFYVDKVDILTPAQSSAGSPDPGLFWSLRRLQAHN